MPEYGYVIKGDPRTKKNSQMIAGAGKRCPVCKKPEKQWIRQSKAHNDFADVAMQQLYPKPPRPIDYPVNVKCIFFMQTRRKVDSLNLLASIDDLLVSAGILEDDNSRIVAAHDGSRVYYDKDNPRTVIRITRMNEYQYKMEDYEQWTKKP